MAASIRPKMDEPYIAVDDVNAISSPRAGLASWVNAKYVPRT
jgi:hypothetical protein